MLYSMRVLSGLPSGFFLKWDLLTLFACFIFLTPSLSQDRCSQALDLGNGDCQLLSNFNGTEDPGTGQFCSTYDNNVYYKFVAQERRTEVVLIPADCMFGSGLEMEIFQTANCLMFDPPLACGATMGLLPLSFVINTNVGETYYIIIDGATYGFGADRCDYTINLIHGICPDNPIVCDTLVDPIIVGEDSICFGQGIYTYEIENYDPGGDYTWTIPDLTTFTDLGQGRIEIDWSNWLGTGSPMVCVAQTDPRCRYAKSCMSIFNETVGEIDPQTSRKCDYQFPLLLLPRFGELFLNANVPPPTAYRVHFYLSRDDLINDVNEVTEIATPGDYEVYIALSKGACVKIPLPDDPAFIKTELLDLEVEVETYCEGESFLLARDVEVRELNGYPGWPWDSLAFFSTASDAAANTSRLNLPYEITEPGTYWAWYQTDNNCYDTVSFDVDFVDLPVFTAENPDTFCSVLGDAVYDLSTTDFTFTTGNQTDCSFRYYQREVNALNDVNRVGPVVSLTGTYWIVAVNSFGCKSEPVPVDVVFEETPYVDIFGNADLCSGDTAEIVITTINAPTPFNLILEDDFGNTFDIYSADATLFYYLPIFESTEIHIKEFITVPETFCEPEFNEDVDFDVITLPTAELDIVTGCGDENGVIFRASQGGIYTVHLHNQNTGIDYVFNGDLNDQFLGIPLMTGDRIVLDSFQYDSMCWSFETFVSDPAVLQPPLEVNNISVGACQDLMSIISFVVSGGDQATYEVIGVPGDLLSGTFTSDPLTSGNYNILVLDGRACDTIDLNIMIDCGCLTEPGVLDIDDTELCENEAITLSLSDTILAPGDLIQFILHDQPLPQTGTILSANNSGEFDFDPLVMNFGQTYFITAWLGVGQNGQVDTTGICSVPTNTVEVQWVSAPEGELFDTLFLCGSPVDTTVRILLSGTGPYTFSYRYNGLTFGPVSTTDNLIDLNLTGVTQSTTLEILNFQNDNCPGEVIGDGLIVVSEAPEFLNLIYTCGSQKDSFYFEVEIQGGTMPYIFSGIDGDLNGNIFTSENLPSGFDGELIMNDSRNCREVELNINRDCECESATGVLSNDEMFLCADSIVDLIFSIDPVIAAGDGQAFLIKNNPALDATGILKIVDNLRIEFDDSFMEYGTTYYFMPVTGILDMNGEIDLGHKCFMPSAPVAFTYYEVPVASVIADNDTLNCLVKEITLEASGSYIPSGFNFEWEVIAGNILSGDQTLMPVVDAAGTYLLRIFHDRAECYDEFSVVVTEDSELATAMIEGDTLLTCISPEITLDASQSSSGSQFSYEWSTDDGNFAEAPDGTLVRVDQSGTYVLVVENTNTLCRDTAFFVVDDNFDYPTADFEPFINTLNCRDVEIEIMADTALIEESDIVSWSSLNPFTNISPDEILISDPGSYWLILENSASGCRDSAEAVIEENIIEPSLQLQDSFFIDCTNNEIDITVNILSGAGGPYLYNWVSPDATIQGDSTLPTIEVIESGTYSVVVFDESNECTSVITTTVFDLQAPIDGTNLTADHSPCGTVNNGSLSLTEVFGGTGPFQLILDDETFEDPPLMLTNISDQMHELTIVDANGCRFDTSFSTRALENVTVELESPVNVDEGNVITIVPSTSGSIDSFMWFIGDSALFEYPNINLNLNPELDQTLTIQVFSSDDCFDMDSMQLFVRKFYNIYVPTAFSPNDDGINDRLMVYGPEKLSSIESFQIYDRWGNCVFERFNILPNQIEFGWDGEVNGNPAATGVFAYQVNATFKDGTTKFISGEFVLMN